MKKVCAIVMALCLLLAGLCPALAEDKTYRIGICQLAPHGHQGLPRFPDRKAGR